MRCRTGGQRAEDAQGGGGGIGEEHRELMKGFKQAKNRERMPVEWERQRKSLKRENDEWRHAWAQSVDEFEEEALDDDKQRQRCSSLGLRCEAIEG